MKGTILIFLSSIFVAVQSSAQSQKMTKKSTPKEILAPCLDRQGRVAEIGESWNLGCVVHKGDKRPRAAISANCVSGSQWTIVCEFGGFALSRYEYIWVKNSKGQWEQKSKALMGLKDELPCQ